MYFLKLSTIARLPNELNLYNSFLLFISLLRGFYSIKLSEKEKTLKRNK